MSRTKPLMDSVEQKRRMVHAKTRRAERWQHDKPNGMSFRQLRRAVANGYSAGVKVKNPTQYLSAHARRRIAMGAA